MALKAEDFFQRNQGMLYFTATSVKTPSIVLIQTFCQLRLILQIKCWFQALGIYLSSINTYNFAPRLLGLQEFANFSHRCITLICHFQDLNLKQTYRDSNLDLPSQKRQRYQQS